MIVVGAAKGKRHKFEVKSRAVDPIWSVCRDITLSDKRQIQAARSGMADCPKCFNLVADKVGNAKPKRGGRHRKR